MSIEGPGKDLFNPDHASDLKPGILDYKHSFRGNPVWNKRTLLVILGVITPFSIAFLLMPEEVSVKAYIPAAGVLTSVAARIGDFIKNHR
ncbi:hypothetical protein HYW44_01455 [Candidatus Daviesbacteria bacterium]|nr:hypothetical protein [Candidatus Daviesbacteria bacterium]